MNKHFLFVLLFAVMSFGVSVPTWAQYEDDSMVVYTSVPVNLETDGDEENGYTYYIEFTGTKKTALPSISSAKRYGVRFLDGVYSEGDICYDFGELELENNGVTYSLVGDYISFSGLRSDGFYRDFNHGDIYEECDCGEGMEICECRCGQTYEGPDGDVTIECSCHEVFMYVTDEEIIEEFGTTTSFKIQIYEIE